MSAQGFVDPYNYQPTDTSSIISNSSAPPSGASLGDKIADLLGVTDTKGNYERWLTERDREYERQATNSARAWDLYMDSTKVQRMVDDIKAAGLNPWLAIQSGLSGGSTATTAGSGSSARAVYSGNNKKGNAVQSIAMFMAASAKLLAVLA